MRYSEASPCWSRRRARGSISMNSIPTSWVMGSVSMDQTVVADVEGDPKHLVLVDLHADGLEADAARREVLADGEAVAPVHLGEGDHLVRVDPEILATVDAGFGFHPALPHS
ncbi:MAG: hypothetical protein O7G30_14780 [Proteobacteria bacterium]|nr:hypothetical protein [Pseudomonadota bacterium]